MPSVELQRPSDRDPEDDQPSHVLQAPKQEENERDLGGARFLDKETGEVLHRFGFDRPYSSPFACADTNEL
jgi:hypothetical protein